MVGWIVGVAALAGLWLLLAGSVRPPELVAGLVCVALAALWTEAAARVGLGRFRLPAPRRLSVPLQVVRDTGRVLLAVVRSLGTPVRGHVDREPVAHPPEAEGGRALRSLGISVAPDSYVVREEDRHVLVHRLVGKP